jgi:DNA-binding response OmpR family regulator
MNKKLLLVEDDIKLSNDIKKQLVFEGFEIDTAFDGLLGERLIQRNQYDCLLFDVNMPGKNGYDLAESVRKMKKTTPIILLTAFGEIEDKLQGFDCGADDYITKPFHFKELLARIKVALKRSEHYGIEKKSIIVADLVIDLAKKQVYRNDVPIKLTAREFLLLTILADAQGSPVSKKELIKTVWGTSFEINTNTIEVFINLLRNKIDKNFTPKLIKTRSGFGYYLGKD